MWNRLNGWGEATDEPALGRQSGVAAARGDARPTSYCGVGEPWTVAERAQRADHRLRLLVEFLCLSIAHVPGKVGDEIDRYIAALLSAFVFQRNPICSSCSFLSDFSFPRL
jgi:hypothetical protein